MILELGVVTFPLATLAVERTSELNSSQKSMRKWIPRFKRIHLGDVLGQGYRVMLTMAS